MSKKRVFFITGARSDYDLLFPVAKELLKSEDYVGEFVVSAAHLSPFHGMGVKEILKDGVKVAGCIESLMSSESWEGRALSFGHLFNGLVQVCSSNRPDLLFIAGDREEALAGALVGNFLRIPVAHTFGGDRCLASDVDEIFRPSISKLAHLHFTATEGHRQRLIKMGEKPEHVWACGGTGLDVLREEKDIGEDELNTTYGIDVSKPFFLMIHHPSPTLGLNTGVDEIRTLLKAVLSFGHPVLCSYPNFDPGNIALRKEIDIAKEKYSNLITYHNLPRSHFVSLYRRCSAIIGNSSSIVIESNFLKVPGILVGHRQDYREIGVNVLRVGAVENEIKNSCQIVLEDTAFLKKVKEKPPIYGDGYASVNIVKIIESLDLDEDLLMKTITY